MVGPVAAADGEDVDVLPAEVLGDAVELVDRAGLADDAVVAERAGRGEKRRAGSRRLRRLLGLKTTPMPGTTSVICPPDQRVVNANRRFAGSREPWARPRC